MSDTVRGLFLSKKYATSGIVKEASGCVAIILKLIKMVRSIPVSGMFREKRGASLPFWA
jgi:hypothetical protein